MRGVPESGSTIRTSLVGRKLRSYCMNLRREIEDTKRAVGPLESVSRTLVFGR